MVYWSVQNGTELVNMLKNKFKLRTIWWQMSFIAWTRKKRSECITAYTFMWKNDRSYDITSHLIGAKKKHIIDTNWWTYSMQYSIKISIEKTTYSISSITVSCCWWWWWLIKFNNICSRILCWCWHVCPCSEWYSKRIRGVLSIVWSWKVFLLTKLNCSPDHRECF